MKCLLTPIRFVAVLAVCSVAVADDVEFQRDIAPILEERCWHCHGEDEQESDLRLDLRAKMLRDGDSGLAAVVPGKPEKSYLVELINHGDADLAGRIASYELAGRMQTSVPEVMDLSGETESTLEAYGVDGGSELRGQYAKNCILARRLLEKGVRVVQLFNGSDPAGGNGITNWDSHSDILKTHAMQAEIMDQPTAALVADMKQRGLLDNTLVVWATEFGRMPFLKANGTGRDHNPGAFTCFLAGAGVKGGFSYGESDEFGFEAAVDKTTVYDFNATILYLLGLDHERLTFYHNGLERRLTNVHGHVIKDVLA